MKNKTLSLLSLSILSLIILVGCVSAVDFHPSELIGSVEQGQTESLTFVIENTHSQDLTNISMTKSDLISGSNTISISSLDILNLPSTISDGQNSSTVTLQIDVPSTQALGTYIGQLELFGTLIANDSRGILNVTLTVTEATSDEPEEIGECSLIGDNGNLKISIEDIQVIEGFGDDEEWFPLDEVEIEIEVENDGDEKIKDIVVGWGLYNLDKEDWVIDDEESDFNLKDGDKETITLNIKLDDVDEFEDGDTYAFYVWATGEDTEYDPEEETCVSALEEIDIIIENDFVVLYDLEVPEVVQCGAEVQILGDVWNIGEDDQDEVVVVLYNKELGLSEEIEIGDIDAFDSEPLDYTFQLPEDAEEKTYTLKLTVYDEDYDIYENDYDEEDSVFGVVLKVEGNCGAVAKASVSAVLESGGQPGKPLVVKATVINTGDKLTTYVLNAAGYADWASSASLDQSTLTLGSGESQEVLLTFEVKKDALGNKLFNLEVLSENELIVSQPVQVTISKRAGITGGVISGDNWYLWGIGALNVILVILIIIIAVRIARK